jgi:hypothetical protein
MNEEQYKLICARRNAFNQLIWQVPTLATAGQAFLLAAALNPLIAPTTSLVLAAFSLVVGAASIQLMAKHRHLEMRDSEALLQFEKENEERGFAILHGPLQAVESVPTNWFVRLSSFRLWVSVLAGFCALALYTGYSATARISDGSRVTAVPSPTQPASPHKSPPAPVKKSN